LANVRIDLEPQSGVCEIGGKTIDSCGSRRSPVKDRNFRVMDFDRGSDLERLVGFIIAIL